MTPKLRRDGDGGSSIHFVHTALFLALLLFALAACAPDTSILSGGSWQASVLMNGHIRVIAVDPNNPQVLYAGSTQGAIFSSTDAGQHWTKRSIAAPTMLYALSLNPSGKKLYASTGAGLFVSTDNAQHWSMVSTPGSGLPSDSYTSLAFANGQNIYAGTAHHGIFTSGSDGATWKAASGNLPQNSAINGLTFDSTQPRLWAATSSGVYRSDDEGRSWMSFNNGLPANRVVNTVQSAVVAGGQELVYAGTNRGLFRSLDSGAHWEAGGQALRGARIQCVLVDFRSTNASTVYVGTNVGAFRSDDNGQNWRGIATGLPRSTPVYALAIGANNASQLYAAANNVYLFPGTNNATNLSRILSLLLIALVFFLLYFLMRHRLGQGRNMLKREPTTAATPPTKES